MHLLREMVKTKTNSSLLVALMLLAGIAARSGFDRAVAARSNSRYHCRCNHAHS